MCSRPHPCGSSHCLVQIGQCGPLLHKLTVNRFVYYLSFPFPTHVGRPVGRSVGTWVRGFQSNLFQLLIIIFASKNGVAQWSSFWLASSGCRFRVCNKDKTFFGKLTVPTYLGLCFSIAVDTTKVYQYFIHLTRYYKKIKMLTSKSVFFKMKNVSFDHSAQSSSPPSSSSSSWMLN